MSSFLVELTCQVWRRLSDRPRRIEQNNSLIVIVSSVKDPTMKTAKTKEEDRRQR